MSEMYTEEQVQAVVRQLLNKEKSAAFWGGGNGDGTALKHDPASVVPDGGQLHGPVQGVDAQGIFSYPGERPEMFATVPRVHGLLDVLPIEKSEYTNERLQTVTGVTDPSSCTNATGFCGDPPDYGFLKGCVQVFNWGDFYAKTHLDILPETGQLFDRADMSRRILNNINAPQRPLIPESMFGADTRSVLKMRMYLLGVGVERSLEDVLINGVNTNTGASAECGFIREFTGLASQITETHTDYYNSNLDCAALDSIVETWGGDIGSTVAGEGTARYISDLLSDVMWSLEDRARTYFMGGVNFLFVMRKDLFRMLTYHIACNYMTYRCTNVMPGNGQAQVDISDQRRLQLSMQQGQFLLIEGVQYPVIFSDGIARAAISDHVYESDVYIIPLSWQGIPLTKVEYFPMDNQYITELANFADPGDTRTINNGLYLVGKRTSPLCIEYHFAARMRLILWTPHLAAAINNVQYEFRAEPRDAKVGDSYYADGGTINRLPWDYWAGGKVGQIR